MTNTDWLTLALVLITAFYAWATFKILKANEGVVAAMREQTEAQLRPYVIVSVSVRVGTTLLLLDIQNTGKSPAVDLKLKMDKDFFVNGERAGKNLAELSVFSQQIDALAPGAHIQFVMGVGHAVFADGVDESVCPKIFSVQAEYTFGERKYTERNTVDLRPMVNSSAIQDPVADELKSLRESLDKALKK